jgi:hypothetical protein
VDGGKCVFYGAGGDGDNFVRGSKEDVNAACEALGDACFGFDYRVGGDPREGRFDGGHLCTGRRLATADWLAEVVHHAVPSGARGEGHWSTRRGGQRLWRAQPERWSVYRKKSLQTDLDGDGHADVEAGTGRRMCDFAPACPERFVRPFACAYVPERPASCRGASVFPATRDEEAAFARDCPARCVAGGGAGTPRASTCTGSNDGAGAACAKQKGRDACGPGKAAPVPDAYDCTLVPAADDLGEACGARSGADDCLAPMRATLYAAMDGCGAAARALDAGADAGFGCLCERGELLVRMDGATLAACRRACTEEPRCRSVVFDHASGSACALRTGELRDGGCGGAADAPGRGEHWISYARLAERVVRDACAWQLGYVPRQRESCEPTGTCSDPSVAVAARCAGRWDHDGEADTPEVPRKWYGVPSGGYARRAAGPPMIA